VTLLGASSSVPPAEPAGNALHVVGWVEAGAAVVHPVQPTLHGGLPHAYLGRESVPGAGLDGQPVSVTAFLTVLVAAVFVVRLGLVLSRKIVGATEPAKPQQYADGSTVADPTAVAASAGRDG
jgi:hypothetical protein